MKKVYVVSSSKDGNLGVYLNAEDAYAKASEYCDQSGGAGETCRTVLNELNNGFYTRIHSVNGLTNVTIEMFYLNEN